MLSPQSQLLLRSEEMFASGTWLLVNPTDGEIFKHLDRTQVFGFHQYFDIYQQSIAGVGEANHQFSAAYTSPECSFEGAVVYLPKSKDHAKMLLANVAACLKPGASLLVVGENKGGIKSSAKLLESFGTQVNKMDSARHCAMFGTVVDLPPKPFDIENFATTSNISIKDISFDVYSLPGVFSHKELDAGTRMLLENITRIPSGRVLDFASGAGIIGAFIGLKNPKSQVVMSDVSALAMHCSERTAQLNKLSVECIPSNGLASIRGRFFGIFTNPPFHTGIKTDYSVTEAFVAKMGQHLTDGGSLTLVANRFLRYVDQLENKFASVNLLSQSTKFSLYYCTRVK